MKILPRSRTEFQTFPVSEVRKVETVREGRRPDGKTYAYTEEEEKEVFFDGVIEVTEQQFRGICEKSLCFSDDLKRVVPFVPTPAEAAAMEREKAMTAIEALKKELADTDYQALKFADGALTAEAYAPVRLRRQACRDEINRLEVKL